MAIEGNCLEAVTGHCAEHPAIRALVAVAKGIPLVGTAIDTLDAAAIATRDKMLAERARELLDDLPGAGAISRRT